MQRHIKGCVPASCLEGNEREFYEKLELESRKLTKELNLLFNAPRLDRRIPRPQPMVTKKVEFTWSRRAWKDENPTKPDI